MCWWSLVTVMFVNNLSPASCTAEFRGPEKTSSETWLTYTWRRGKSERLRISKIFLLNRNFSAQQNRVIVQDETCSLGKMVFVSSPQTWVTFFFFKLPLLMGGTEHFTDIPHFSPETTLMRQCYYGHFTDKDFKLFQELGPPAQCNELVEQCPTPETMLPTPVGGLPTQSAFLCLGTLGWGRRPVGPFCTMVKYLNSRI